MNLSTAHYVCRCCGEHFTKTYRSGMYYVSDSYGKLTMAHDCKRFEPTDTMPRGGVGIAEMTHVTRGDGDSFP